MKDKFAFTKGRLIGFCCCALLPIIVTGLGIRILTNDVLLNLGFAVTYFALPLIAAVLLALCIFSGSKAWKKVVLSGVVLFLFVVSFFWFSIFMSYVQIKHYDGADVEMQYATVMDKNELMPELSEVGQPVDIEYHNVLIEYFIFAAETDYLICHYSPEEYETRKAVLENEYIFMSKTVAGSNADCEDGYHFRLLSTEEYKAVLSYPKCLVFVGYSDDAHEIVYAAFEDWDLDTIPSLKDFIVDDCGWKYVR